MSAEDQLIKCGGFSEIATAAKPCENPSGCLAGLRCKFSSAPSKSRFCSFVKILFWVENPLLWRGIRDGQNSCCTCHNTKGWKHICVLRKQAGNKLFTVHSSVLTLYFDFDFGGSDNGEDALKIALGKNVRSAQLASKSTNLRPGTQKTFGRKNTGTSNKLEERTKQVFWPTSRTVYAAAQRTLHVAVEAQTLLYSDRRPSRPLATRAHNIACMQWCS